MSHSDDDHDHSSNVYAGIMSVIVFTLTILLYRRYARPDEPYLVPLSTILGWFVSFCPLFILPIDLHSLPSTGTSDPLLPAWSAVYWTGFLLTFLAIPYLQYFLESGYTTFSHRIKEAAYTHALYNAVGAVAALVLIIVLAVRDHIGPDQVLAVLAALSNTVGLFLYVLLLGYGLVKLPRTLWYRLDKHTCLRELYLQALRTSDEHDQAMDALKEAAACVQVLERKLLGEFRGFVNDESSTMMSILDEVRAKLPESLTSYKAVDHRTDLLKAIRDGELQLKTFVQLHRLVKAELSEVRRTSSHLETLYEQIRRLEDGDIVDGRASVTDTYEKSNWEMFQLVMYKSGAVLCALLSCIVLYQQLTLGAKDSSSIFYHLCDFDDNEIQAQIFASILLLYLCACAYFALFRLRIMQFYHMHGHAETSASSMLQNCAFLIKVSFPLGLNFLDILRVRNSAYQRIIQANVVPILGNTVYVVLPVTITVFAALTLFNVFGRLLKAVKLGNVLDDVVQDVDVKQGRMIIAQMNRKQERMQRDEDSRRNATLYNRYQPPQV